MAEKKTVGRKPSASTQLARKLNKKKEEDISIPNSAVHVCTCCSNHGTKSNIEKLFYISYSPFHARTGRAPLCKECVFKMSTIKGELNINMFVEVIRALDRPFINTIFEASIQESLKELQKEMPVADRDTVLRKKAEAVIGIMMKNLSLPQYKHMTWLDGDQRYIPKDSEFITDINDLGEEMTADELVYKWGEGYTESQYVYLENRYNTLTAMANVEFESDAMMLKEICLEELELRIIRTKGGDTSKKLKTIQELMATANIRPTDIKNANSDILNDSYGKWIKTIEDYEPAEYFEDKHLYEDFDGLRKYFLNWVLRPLKNLLKGTRDFQVEE